MHWLFVVVAVALWYTNAFARKSFANWNFSMENECDVRSFAANWKYFCTVENDVLFRKQFRVVVACFLCSALLPTRFLISWNSKGLFDLWRHFFSTRHIQTNLNWPFKNINTQIFKDSKNKLEMSLLLRWLCVCVFFFYPKSNKLYRYIPSYKSGASRKVA